MRFFEQPKRSIAKSVSHRSLVIISDTIIIFVITHKYEVTISLVILTNVAATIIYYFHERAWNISSWGRTHKR
ncbi:MAG: DUF2061 domain-containing protein [Candidatus Saccharimonadia bacterium]